MPLLSKLIKLWALGRALTAGVPSFHRILAGFAAIAILMILAAILTGVLMVGLLYFGYDEMILHGIDQRMALGITAGVTLLLIVCMIGGALFCWHRLKSISGEMLRRHQSPLALKISNVIHSFLDGLMGQDDDKNTPSAPHL